MPVTLAQMQEDVLQLTKQERAALLTTIVFTDRHDDPGLSREEQFVFDALREITGSRVPQMRFLESMGRRKFGERVAELYQFARTTGGILRRHQIDSLVTTALQCLASELRGREIAATPKSVINNLSQLRHAVDLCFPGYIAAGLLHRVAA